MIEVVINSEWCKGCGLCVHFCQQDCLSMGSEINAKGYSYPVFGNEEECNGCTACGKLCPDLAINIYKYKDV